MNRFRNTLLIPLALLAFTTASRANTILMANLTNSAEVPPTTPMTSTGAARPASFGTAMFVLNDAMTQMTMVATVFNIDFTGSQTTDTNDNLIAAHIHAGPGITPATTGPVVWGFFGTPFNDNNPNDVVQMAFTSGVGGTIMGKWDAPEGNNTTLAAQIPFLLGGQAYINFHTNQYTGGEIRGNIFVVPEPATLGLFSAGAIGMLVVRRRRART